MWIVVLMAIFIDIGAVPQPTPAQLDWIEDEISVLITWNMATFVSPDSCSYEKPLPAPEIFSPTLTDTNNWMQTIHDLGARSATLVIRHGCGFVTYPSSVPLPSPYKTPYNYSVAFADQSVQQRDFVLEFSQACRSHGIKVGIYFNMLYNYYMNVVGGQLHLSTLFPYQVNVSLEAFDNVSISQLTELLSGRYGELHELWFDSGGLRSSQFARVKSLIQQYQPQVNIMSQGTTNLTRNAIRNSNSESGFTSDPTWSTAFDCNLDAGAGDPDGTQFCGVMCDTTLQLNGDWFWRPYPEVAGIRSLVEMIDVYHKTVGRNCLLELDLTPDSNGLIPPLYAQRYKELGDFIRTCYTQNVRHPSKSSCSDQYCFLHFDYPTNIDRTVIREDQRQGQLIRAYQIDVQLEKNGDWIFILNGTSVGNKKIDLFQNGPIKVSSVRLTLTKMVGPARIRQFTAHLCGTQKQIRWVSTLIRFLLFAVACL